MMSEMATSARFSQTMMRRNCAGLMVEHRASAMMMSSASIVALTMAARGSSAHDADAMT